MRKKGSSGADTRDRLIVASLRLFQKKGFHRVGLPEIGKAIGISHSSIYEYFANKEDLMLACTQKAFEMGRASVDAHYDEHDPADRKLKGLITGNLQAAFGAASALVAQVVAIHYFAAFDPKLMKILEEMTSLTQTRIQKQIEQGNRERTWQIRQPARAAYTIHSLMLAEMFKGFLGLQHEKREAVIARVWSAVESLLAPRR